MRTVLPLLTILVLFAHSTVVGFPLVDPGKNLQVAPVILFKDAPPITRQAAEDLVTYIEKVCGQRPELLDNAPNPIPKRAIWIGVQPELKTAFPGLDFSFTKPEEILIAANDQHLVIAGRDVWDPDHLVVEGIDEKIEGKQSEYGTANAIYTFLQDQLGIRWLWPDELGEDIPKKETISFTPFEHRFHPPIRGRTGAFNFSALSNKGYGKSHRWCRLQRLQLSSIRIGGGHGFGNWWERYHKSHPEIFALQPDGTRSGHPGPRTVKLCQSNPLVWDLWLKGVEEQLEADPTRTLFNGSPNDGWSSGHCTCEKCRAWDHPDGEPRLMHWYHFREERPALSDRHVTFANRLSAKLKQQYPGKDYYVVMLSYGHSRPAPVEARPAENVIMVSVANFYGRHGLIDRGSTRGTSHREQFEAWGKLAHHLMWRPNTGSPAGWQHGLPDVSIQQTIDDIKFLHQNNGIGIFIDSVWEHWATQGPQYYVMSQLLWNPKQDGQAILDDYYQRGFGSAANEIREYFELFETARTPFLIKYEYKTERRQFPEIYTKGLLGKADEILQRAAAKTAAGDDIHAKRVDFIRTGLEYTRLAVENIALMDAYWDQPDEKVAERVQKNWEKILAIGEKYPRAINQGPIRPITSRMIGVHPDHPNPKRKKKPARKEPRDRDQN